MELAIACHQCTLQYHSITWGDRDSASRAVLSVLITHTFGMVENS